ncbi:Tyrosinase [Diplonema papillatum]|nr:Tyrosinase [Diplonema papillatum]
MRAILPLCGLFAVAVAQRTTVGTPTTAVVANLPVAKLSWELDIVIRLYCTTSCGKTVKNGWSGYVDASECTKCTCFSGALSYCQTDYACLRKTYGKPECLGEDDDCDGLAEHCPAGTKCTKTEYGEMKCVQTANNAVCGRIKCDTPLATCKVSAYSTGICRLGCQKSCGGYVPHGWSGYDDGSNHCNRCFCQSGQMTCTLMYCLDSDPCPGRCTPYTEPKPCFLTALSSSELHIEAAKPLTGALTFRRLCWNAATCKCGFYPRVLCFQNPCNTVSCRAGYHCEPNYCGGCNHRCVKDKCPGRERKAYSSLSCAERNRFVRAIKELKSTKPSEWDDFVSMHGQAWSYAHSSNEFFPWHRWYLVGFENALRSLGGEFECITLPYWDWEKDAGSESSTPPLRCNTFGRTTGTDASNCVDEGVSNKATWAVSGGGCLKRNFGGFGFAGEATIINHITTRPSYSSFRPPIEGLHGTAHVWVGGHMAGVSTAPEDPLFWMHHCNIDRMWALWQDYHGYDEVAKNLYTNLHYANSAALNNIMPMDIDAGGSVMSYFTTPVSIRDMMHIHDMPGGNSYTYGSDTIAFTLVAPVSGSWSWVTPGTLPRVNCFAACFIDVIKDIAFTPIWFHNTAIPLEKNFKALTCKKDTTESRLEAFNTLAKAECKILSKQPMVSEDWIKTMWRNTTDTDVFKHCYGLDGN